MGVAMKTRLMTSVHARRMATSLVLVAALLVSGATLGTATDGEPIDAAAQAAWLAEHFDCEYGTAMEEA
jgi:cytochrome c oxidase assembly factor CtaG